MPGLFHHLPRNVLTIFSGRNLAWHALAIILTLLIVKSGLDWTWYLGTRSAIYVWLALPAITLGGLLPLLGIPAILVAGWVSKNHSFRTVGWALGQTALLGWLVSSSYKAFTGRLPPPFTLRFHGGMVNHAPLVDTSHGFQLGFLRGGIFWGWPSGHTTVAFAMTASLIALFSRHQPKIYLLLLYPLYVGLSVSVTIHWLSEFVAGAIIGSVIGTVVGNSYKSPSPDA
jgi:membrane-associated phospholipid phosphatase